MGIFGLASVLRTLAENEGRERKIPREKIEKSANQCFTYVDKIGM